MKEKTRHLNRVVARAVGHYLGLEPMQGRVLMVLFQNPKGLHALALARLVRCKEHALKVHVGRIRSVIESLVLGCSQSVYSLTPSGRELVGYALADIADAFAPYRIDR